MDAHVKERPSRPSPTRFGKAALLYDQWGAEPRKQLMESCTGYGLHEYSMEYGLPRTLLCGQWGAEPKVVRSMVHGSSLHKCDVLY